MFGLCRLEIDIKFVFQIYDSGGFISDRAEPIKLGAFWGMHYIHHLHLSLNIGDSDEIWGEISDLFYICTINGAELIFEILNYRNYLFCN